MESIEKLRELIYDSKLPFGASRKFYEAVYGIEREIEETIERDYMKLPVDADGVPIRVGSKAEERLLRLGQAEGGRRMTEYILDLTAFDGETLDDGLREEIVRCRDCKHADETESGALHCIGYLTEPWDWYNDEPSNGVKVEPNGYCAWGERREDDR